MNEITFDFQVGQHVTTPFGTKAIVTTCAVDNAGIQYYVNTAAGGMWFPSGQLVAEPLTD